MTNIEKALEKSVQIFDKLTLNEAIEAYHELGKKLHDRIAAKQQEAELQMKKLIKLSETHYIVVDDSEIKELC